MEEAAASTIRAGAEEPEGRANLRLVLCEMAKKRCERASRGEVNETRDTDLGVTVDGTKLLPAVRVLSSKKEREARSDRGRSSVAQGKEA